jgi:hypothetical protein
MRVRFPSPALELSPIRWTTVFGVRLWNFTECGVEPSQVTWRVREVATRELSPRCTIGRPTASICDGQWVPCRCSVDKRVVFADEISPAMIEGQVAEEPTSDTEPPARIDAQDPLLLLSLER